MGVSVVVLARDEASRIEHCLKSVRWCDEVVVVVDDSSVDDTESIARRFTSHVSRRAFTSFSDQRRYADGLASQDWVLSIDCDERVSDVRRVKAAAEHGDSSRRRGHHSA